MGGARADITEERLSWFKTFMPLYERAAPLIWHIANIEKLKAGQLPVSPYMFVESSLTLRPILECIRNMRKPKDKQLANIKMEFEIALHNCIRAAESASNYIRLEERSMDSPTLLSTIINSTVLAYEYIESVSKRLGTPSTTILNSQHEFELTPAQGHLKEMESATKDVTPPPNRLQIAINKAANGIERGLDRLGDGMTLPLEKMAKYSERLRTLNRKR